MGYILDRSAFTAVLLCIGLWLSHCLPVGAQTSAPLTLSYIGLDNVHVAYDHVRRSDDRTVRLEVLIEGSVIHTVELTQSAGEYHHTGLANGSYTYRISEYRGDQLELLVAERAAILDGANIGGTLLFDETVGTAFSCKVSAAGLSFDLNIPEGIVLDLLNAVNSGACRIKVDGTVRLGNVLWNGSDLQLTGAGAVSMLDTSFTQGLSLFLGSGVNLDVSNSLFRGSLRIEGASQNVRFTGNQFVGGVDLYDRLPAVFTGNVFLGPLDLYTASGTQTWCNAGVLPTVSDNSFLGRMALTASGQSSCTSQTLFRLGSNYYGDSGGPSYILPSDRQPLADVDYRSKWLQRGAGMIAPPFDAKNMSFEKSGIGLDDNRISPQFWLGDERLGQHVLGGTAPVVVRGKESLYSIDLVTSHQEVRGAKLWVMWNGERVESTVGPEPTLRRDHGERAILYRAARTSIEFILPPVLDGDSAKLELWLDSRELEGHGGGELRKLQDLTVALKAPPGPLGVHLVPVSVNNVMPSLSATRNTVASLLPAMLPVVPENLRISATSYSPSFSNRFIPTSVFVNIVATNLLRYRLAMEYDPVDYPKGELMDFVIGVMPAGSLGGADGVYMNLRRRVILVDENRPDAFLHEMGHAIGLYNLREQYNWPNYPPIGRPVEGYTLFLNQPTVASGQIALLFQSRDGRVTHVPRDFNWWHDEFNIVVDVMGNQTRFWPHPTTLKFFEDYLYQLGSTRPVPQSSAQMARRSDELRQVLVTMDTERVERVEGTLAGERRCVTYQPVPGTIRLFGRADVEAMTNPPAGSPVVVSDAALPLCLDDTGSQFMNPTGDVSLCVVPVDPFMPELEECQRVLAPELVHTSRLRDLAFFSFDVPQSTVAFSLVTRRSSVSPVVIRASQSISLQLQEPLSGTRLGDTVTLRWQGTSVPRDPDFPSAQPLLYQVSASTDNGLNWQALGLPVSEQELIIDTAALPAGDSIALRVSATDGFQFVHAQATDLRLAPRPPEVEILSPLDGDQAGIDQPWVLRAWAWDVEANTSLVGSWHSSLDGELGTGALLANIVLSQGVHELSYRVTDGLGEESQASLQVQVQSDPVPTLTLAADAFDLSMPWRDPVIVGPLQLRMDSPQIASLTVRNSGVGMNAALRLWLQAPGDEETLLVEESLRMEPFEIHALAVPVTATQSGDHRFRGELVTLTDDAIETGMDERSWTIDSVRPPELTPQALTLAFGTESAQPVFRTLSLNNTGGQSLIVKELDLEQEGQNPQPFQIWEDHCSNVGLAPAERCEVVIRFSSDIGTAFSAELWVSATDSDDPQLIVLSGWTGTDPGAIFHDSFEGS